MHLKKYSSFFGTHIFFWKNKPPQFCWIGKIRRTRSAERLVKFPRGSATSILYSRSKLYGLTPKKEIAGLMLAGAVPKVPREVQPGTSGEKVNPWFSSWVGGDIAVSWCLEVCFFHVPWLLRA